MLERIVIILLIIGTCFDQLSTRIGLSFPHIYEANINTLWLIEHRLWIPVDIAYIIAWYLIFRLFRLWIPTSQGWISYVPYVGPVLYSILRLGAGVWNTYLILTSI